MIEIWHKKPKTARLSITICGLFVISAALFTGIFLYSLKTFAAGGASGNDHSSGGGGGKCNQFTWDGGGQHTCIGAAWMKFNVGAAPSGSPGGSQYNEDKVVLDKIDKKCADYGQYYRYGLARFEASGGKFVSFKDHQLAYFKWPQDNLLYAANAPGALEINSVKQDFDKAQAYWKEQKKNGATLNQDTEEFINSDWGTTSWFCWNEGLYNGSATSTFGAWSSAIAKDNSGTTKLTVNTSSIDSRSSGTLKTKEDTITVDFRHRFNYEKPTSGSGKFGPAITKYGVEVTGAVYQTVVPAGTQYTVTDSGPDRSIGPLEPNTVGDSTQVINVPRSGSVQVCSKISYDPKIIGWKSKKSGGFEMDPATTKDMGKSSEVCVTIERAGEDEEETEDGGQIRFWSTSTVEVPGNQKGNDVSYHQETSNSEGHGKVTAKLSTDGDALDVNFWHTLFYKHESRGGGQMQSEPHTGQDKLLDDICTNYGINQTGNARNANQTKESGEQYCVEKDKFTTNMVSPGKKVKADKYSFHIEGIGVGETVTVCQKISYQPEVVTLTRTKKTKKVKDGLFPVDRFDAKEMEELYFYNPYIRDYMQINIWDTINRWEEWTQFWYNDADGTPIYNNTGWELYTYDWDDNIVPVFYMKYHEELDHYEYNKESDQPGEGYSEACVEVTRPAGASDPSDGGIRGPFSGDPDTSFMYAGETSTISWDVEAWAYKTRRLMGAEAIIFDPRVDNAYDPGIVLGSIPSRTSSNPCGMFGGRFSLRTGCQVPYNGNSSQIGIPSSGIPGNNDSNNSIQKSINFQTPIVVPDHVGDKYCNSFGFYWQYWYGVTQEKDGSITEDSWRPESRTYWMNYDAACRTIVKKPSTSIWNGGLFTEGSVQTTTSNRCLAPIFGDLTCRSDRRKFGSWAEYLAVVNGTVHASAGSTGSALGSVLGGSSVAQFGFSSGAALAYNGSTANDSLLANSPLTIANTGNQNNAVGNSGISANSTFRARLSSYLMSRPTQTNLDNLQGVTDTRVVRIDRDVNITSPITIAEGPYPTIYQLPQIVIFVNGNINISSEVERIDAWLISTGTINTCSEFKNTGDDRTPAFVKNYNTGADCSKQLTVNGPIIAQDVILNRSAGSDPITYGTDSRVGGDARATSGEVFNLSADTYLWAYAQAGRYDSSYSEAYTRELPPRY